jgi:hypothetical protein
MIIPLDRGGVSLMELFLRECPNADPFQYIGFFSLRNWGVMNEKVVTEQVYVHDKVSGPVPSSIDLLLTSLQVMIVDDRVVIIGSANLTDRSLAGEQDSEVRILPLPPLPKFLTHVLIPFFPSGCCEN